MHRPVVGGCVLVAALLLTITPSRLIGGAAVEMALFPVPTAGMCLIRPIGHAPAGPGTPGPDRVGPDEIFDDPGASLFGTCGGAIGGEVVSVQPKLPTATVTDSPAVAAASADNNCWAAVVRYAGLDPSMDAMELPEQLEPDGSTSGKVRWRMQVELVPRIVHADPTSERIGRGWTACTVTPHSGEMYTGSARNAYAGGELPSAFGSCRISSDSTAARVSCSSRHSAELLAVGETAGTAGTNDSEVVGSCHRLATRLLRTGDPSVGGGLRVVAQREPVQYQDNRNATPYRCLVAVRGDRLLDRTVTGLGNRPLPFAG